MRIESGTLILIGLAFLAALVLTVVVGRTILKPGPAPPLICNHHLATIQEDCPKHSTGNPYYCKVSPNAALTCADLARPMLTDVQNVCNKIGVDIVSTCTTYKQYWNSVRITNPATGKSKDRHTAIAIPRCGARPQSGWPVVFYFQFMSADGKSEGWGKKGTPGGILPFSYIPDKDPYGRIPLMNLLVALTVQGYAVVMTSEWARDSYFYAECNDSNPGAICWNDQKNPDLPYMKDILTKMNNGTLVSGEKLDYSKIGVLGYSVGAQMVSRCINDFPLLKLSNGKPFPKIGAAIMLGGGTMGCYNDSSNLGPCCIEPECPGRCKKTGKVCRSWCCPSGVSEPNYDNGVLPWDTHPPVLLLQTEKDAYADIYAWSKYFDAVSSKSRNKVDLYAVIAGGVRHGLCSSQIDPILNFIKHYI